MINVTDQNSPKTSPLPFGGFEPVAPLEFEDAADSPELRPEAVQFHDQKPHFTPPQIAAPPPTVRKEAQWVPDQESATHEQPRRWRTAALRALVVLTPVALIGIALIAALRV